MRSSHRAICNDVGFGLEVVAFRLVLASVPRFGLEKVADVAEDLCCDLSMSMPGLGLGVLAWGVG